MELWIRSQDKKVLRKVYSLGIYERNDKWHIAENLMMDFGVYKTEKRALEVLDEIQNYIDELNKAITNYSNVYKMPEE